MPILSSGLQRSQTRRAILDAAREGFVKRIWRFLWKPSARFSFAGLLIVGFAGGILAWGGFNWVLELTNTESFCISCHEMRNTPFDELKGIVRNVAAHRKWHLMLSAVAGVYLILNEATGEQ